MAFNRDKALKEADKLVAKGKDKDAIRLLLEIVKNDPRDMNSLNKIGDLHLKVGDKAAAVDAFAQVAEKYATDGFNLRAIAMYKKCTRTEPARIDFVERLADLNAQQGLTNEAKVAFAQVAEHYLREGKSQKARETYARIVEIEPDNLKNRLKLADLYLRENQIRQALGEYQVIGTELAKKGMLDESLQVLEKALGLDPSNIGILRAVARTRADMGRADEGIRFIRQKLEERGGRDPDLLLVLAETYQAAGQPDVARQALDRAAELAPERADIRMALHRLALAQGDPDGALGHYDRLLPALVAEGKAQQVLDDLKTILRVRESHAPTLERILSVLGQTGDTRAQAEWMGRVSEAYIAAGRYGEAERVLTRLVQLESDVAQHAEKLEFVRVKLRSGDASVPAATPSFGSAATAPPAAPAADEMSFGGLDSGEGGGFSMSFEDGELDSDAGRGDDRSEFVSERTAEADVFIKYGLVDKAVEQLQGILARYADDVPTRVRLRQLLADEGRRDEAVEQGLALVALHHQSGDAAAESEALAAVVQIAPGHPAIARAGGMEPGTGSAPKPAAAPSVGGFDLGLDSAPAAPPAPAAAAAGRGGVELSFDSPREAPAPASTSGGLSGFDLGGDETSFDLGSPAPAEPAGFDLEIEVDEPAGFALGDGSDDVEIELDAPVPPARALAPAPASDEFEISLDGDADSEMEISFDDEPSPTSPASAADIEISLDEPEPAEVALELDADLGASAPAPMTVAAAPEPAPVAGESEEGLFGEEDDFFDFAEEINREMETEDGMTEVSRSDDRGMTLEEIVSGIQKGVAAQVDKEDYETHYNLGIAYREMGLQDEAIGEFQYASRDPTRFLLCCIHLGNCFTEKGMPELAIQWYEKAKLGPDITDEDRLALEYEIALCHEALGDDAKALKSFMTIYGTNARYRDVSHRVARLKQGTGR